jgi:hypothetical protein
MRLIAKSVLIAIIIVGVLVYIARAAYGSLDSVLVVLAIGAVLLDPVISKKPARFARSLVIAALLASASFGLVLVFTPATIQAVTLLMLGLLIGIPLHVLIEQGRIAPDEARWLPTLGAFIAAIMSIALVGFAFIGESIAHSFRALGASGFEPMNPWVSFIGPTLYYLAIALPQYRVLGKKAFVISSVVFAIVMSIGVFAIYRAGLV